MKKFDQEYRLLEAMYEDTYFPDFDELEFDKALDAQNTV